MGHKEKYFCIITTSGIGGVWSVVKESILLLSDIYETYLIIYTQCGKIEKGVIAFLEYHRISYYIIDIPTSNGWVYDFYRYCQIGRLKKIIGKGPAIIHSHDSYISGSVLFPLRKLNYKLFCTFHGTMFPCTSLKSYIQYFFNKCIRIPLIQMSQATLVSCDPCSIPIIEKYFRNRKIELAINGVIPSDIKHVRSNKDGLVIGYISRFHPLKGWKILAQAVKNLNDRGYNIILYFAGKGECDFEIQSWCSLNKHCVYLGHVDDVKKDIFHIIDVHVLPTMYPEGLPMIILETMAASIPTITTNVGSCAYAVKDGVNGFIINPTIADLESKILELYCDKELYAKMQTNCYDIWLKFFSSRAMVNNYYRIFNKIE